MDSHWLISAGLVTLSIIAISANAFLLLIFCRRRGLRTVPNRFVINLLITNLLSSLLLIPLLVVDNLSHFHPNSSLILIEEELFNNNSDVKIIETLSTLSYFNASTPILCYSAQMSTSFVTTLSILSILLIGINQYFGVIHSLRYHVYINKWRSSASILVTWLTALFLSLLNTLTQSDSYLWRFCGEKSTAKTLQVFNGVYALTYFLTLILAPFLAICVIYVCIYAAAHRNSERMRKSNSTMLAEEERTLPKVRSAPNFLRCDELRVIRTSGDFITSIKHKISNASVFRYREETRAAKISVLVIFLVLFCYVPYGVTLVLNSGLVRVATSQFLNVDVVLLLVVSNLISPFLFGYRNKRVKREIGKVFGVTPPRQPEHAILHRRRSANDDHLTPGEPFLDKRYVVPEVIVTCKAENEKKSILKRVCQSSGWSSYKKCNFITVPEGCIGGEARGSFSSTSTQTSNEDC